VSKAVVQVSVPLIAPQRHHRYVFHHGGFRAAGELFDRDKALKAAEPGSAAERRLEPVVERDCARGVCTRAGVL
jgi:hypothetical protein